MRRITVDLLRNLDARLFNFPQPFDKLRASGGIFFSLVLSLSKDKRKIDFGRSLLLLFLLCLVYPTYALSCPITITPQQLRDIGNKIWKNESNNSIELLTFWHKNEPFPSLGIGHCIWFPANCQAPYTQTFPDLMLFFKKHGVKLPAWLAAATACPWPTRASFYAPENKARLRELQQLLSNTIELQAQFMFDRLCTALPTMLATTNPAKRAHVAACFDRIVHAPNGMYALVDYVNFKGDGTNVCERYAGYGWGLLQVLEHMDSTNANALEAFVISARAMLERRVAHAVHTAVEQRALVGWLKRINTYTR